MSSGIIRAIQHELSRKGFNPGAIDSVWGRRTEAAVIAFQLANGLVADGIVGPITWLALFGEPLDAPPFTHPGIPWFLEARRQFGTKEMPGEASNLKILNWASDAGIPYKSDDIPWCGLFVAHCVSATLHSEPLPNNPLGARQWLKFGVPCEPSPGAVLVFWRVSRAGGKGHVGFYAGEDENGYNVLGGNQRDTGFVSAHCKGPTSRDAVADDSAVYRPGSD